MLDESAEIQRVSRDALDRPEIFLARRQPLPWGGSGLSPGIPDTARMTERFPPHGRIPCSCS